MYHVYVIRSEVDGRLYTGVTADLGRRLAQHNRGNVRSTARRRPLVLIYSEEFATKAEAADRERYFKTPEGGALKRRLIAGSDSLQWETRPVARRGAGVVDRDGLENRCTPLVYRGFESHPLRHLSSN